MYKVMFVDDEEQNLFLMEKIIDWEENGFRVCGIALDGMEGIQVFEETEPDVVFVDIRMDEMDGLELIERLRMEGKEAVYVIVTAYDEFSYAKKAIALGARDYLLKPVSRKELLLMIGEIRKELDEEKVKEAKSRFINRQYENSIFSSAFLEMETNCLKKLDPPVSEKLDSVIKHRSLRSFELFSPTEDPEELMCRVKDWDAEYCFPGYDCIYLIAEEEKAENIRKMFEKLKSHNLKRRFILQINGGFSDAEGLALGYCRDFPYRSLGFYERQSHAYVAGEMLESEGIVSDFGSFWSQEQNRAAMHGLIYHGDAREAEAYVRDLAEDAREQKKNSSTLADEMIEILFCIKSELTNLYKDRAFLVLRHRNIWDLHRIRTEEKLVLRMQELLWETAEAVRDILENKGNYSLMGRTIEYIGNRYADPEFSAGEVAEMVHLSRNYFLKLFKEEMGTAFWDYVTNVRMEKAKWLLKDTEDTVYAVSRAVGYESQYHFSRKFKNLYGISPNEYRNL